MEINYFLKQGVKKIILLILVIPIIIQFVLINVVQWINDELLYYLTFVLIWLFYLPYFYWLNVTIKSLYAHSNKYFNLKLKRFNISLIINCVVLLNFVFFVAYIFSFVFLKEGKPNVGLFPYIGLIQLVGIVSFFYNGYFVSKLIATIELKRNVHFTDIAGNLIIFTFPPLAVWFIYNKIKKMELTRSR